MLGRWLVPAREGAAILAHAGDLVDEPTRRLLASYANAPQSRLDVGACEAAFEAESMMLHFAEHFPDEVLASEAARRHVARSTAGAGVTTALAARYFEVTRDPRAKETLVRLLERAQDGLYPSGAGQEAQFALHYLVRGGVPLSAFAPEVDRVEATLREDGAPIDLGLRVTDCDASAVAQIVCHAAGRTTKMATSRLERFWNEARGAYQSADGQDTWTVSTTVHVLEAHLRAPDVGHDDRARVYRRTVRLLEERPWVELHHLSPFYVWEAIVGTFFPYAHAFPDAPTRVHHEALARVLEGEVDRTGGFRGPFVERANLEESALALLALRAALRGELPRELRTTVARTAERARAFVARALDARDPTPDLWVGKLLYAPEHIVRAIATAALAHPAELHARAHAAPTAKEPSPTLD
jgi:hypothetical protein